MFCFSAKNMKARINIIITMVCLESMATKTDKTAIVPNKNNKIPATELKTEEKKDPTESIFMPFF
jgi:hypothetical protein